jgi:chitodextrinase
MKTKFLFFTLFYLFIITFSKIDRAEAQVKTDISNSSLKQIYKRISVNNSNLLLLENLGIDLTCGAILKDNKIELELSEFELGELTNSGVNYEVIVDDLEKFYSERAQKNLPRAKQELEFQKSISSKAVFGKSSVSNILFDNVGQYNGCDEINWATPTNFKLGSMGGCLTVSEALAELDLMRTLYPSLISVKTDASPTNQTTVEGRTTYFVRISDNPDIDELSEPETLYTGMTHSREVSSLMNLVYYMWYILENYGSDPAITTLINNQELYFIPIVNSDGLAYNESILPNGGGLQRKNRNIYGGSCATTSEGVDLNRNFGYYWGNGGSSTNVCNETYRGPNLFSEPESQIVRDFFLEHDFKLVLNHHSFKNANLHGYAGVDPAVLDAAGVDRREDEFAKYNYDMTYFNRYAYGPSTQISALNSGNMNDWMMGPSFSGSTGGPGSGKDAMAWTPENGGGSEAGSTGSGFWPNPIFIDDIARRAMRSNFLAAYFSGQYAKLIDLTSSNIASVNGNLDFGIEFLGQTSSDLTLSLSPISNNITSLISPNTQTGVTTLEQRNVSAAYTLDAGIQPNDAIEYKVSLSNDNGILYEANIIKYYSPTVLFEDGEETNGISNWTATGGSWGIISDPYTGSVAITDSPSGPYSNSESKTLQLNNPISTTSLLQTVIQYYAKWDLERSFDYVQIEASSNGSIWIPLCGTYTKPGAPNANNTYSGKSSTSNNFQPDGEQLYDGDTQDKWVMEELVIDASNNSAFHNKATVYFRFNFNSDATNNQDSYTTVFDGFVFDDFKIITNTTNIPQTITFNTLGDKFSTDAPFQVSASATSGLPVTYSIVSGPATISGDTITLTGAIGTVMVRASQAGDSTYNAATDIDQSFEVIEEPSCSGTLVNTFPYSESFEGSGSGGLGDWTQYTLAPDTFDWTVNSGGTSTNNTGPSSANDGNYYLYTEASGNDGETSILISPCFDLNNKSAASFTYNYHMYGSDISSLSVQVSTDDGSNWSSNLWSLNGDQGDSWNSNTINLDGYINEYIKLRFIGVIANSKGQIRGDMAIDNIGLVATSFGPDITPPSTPTGLITSNTTQTTTDLSWNASNDNVGVTGYDVYQNGGFLVNTASVSYQVTGLIGSTSYSFYVIAKDAAGNSSGQSNTVNTTTLNPPDTEAPATPTNLVAANTTFESTDLSWVASTDNVGVTGYDIYQNGGFLINVSTLSYQVTGLSPSTPYTFYVIARDAAGNSSGQSNTANITTEDFIDTEPPTTPTGLSVSNTTETTTDLSWNTSNDNIGVTGYDIYQNGAFLVNSASITYQVTGLISSTPYSFYVIAKDAAGNSSGQSNTVNTTTQDPPDTEAPSTPANLVAANTTFESTDLSWDVSTDNVDVTGYDIYQDGNFIINVSTTSYQVTGLSPSAAYTFYVIARDASGNSSGQSNTTNITTEAFIDTEPPTTPNGLSASNTSETTTDLYWNASSDNVGVTGYDVYQNGGFISNVSGTNDQVTGLTENTSYSFYVIARDAAGLSSGQSNTLYINTLAAPTCNDGIQNGNETGVDCGGTTCPVCPPTDTILHEGYFETGLDGWTLGGKDASLSSTSLSYEGFQSIKLRDNSGIDSSMSSPILDLSPYNQIEIDFYFYANSMENGEDVWLRYNDGSGWVTVATWVSSSSFNDNAFNNVTFTLDSGSFYLVDGGQFRIQCDASGKNDQVYIDQVVITGIGSGSARATSTRLSIPKLDSARTEFTLYPNPVKGNVLNVSLSEYNRFAYAIKNMLGQVVVRGNSQGQVDITLLKTGVYFIEVNDIMTKRFIRQ